MTYELIVLGGGPAGYLAAERAGQAGLSVACIEERHVGGVCLNEGCIPTKTLLYSAKLYDGAVHGEKYGVNCTDISLDHARVIARKDKVVRTLVAGVKAALRSSGAALIEGRGVIAGRSGEDYLVDVNGEQLRSRHLLIATGSHPAVPPIPGLAEGLETGFVLTNREILALTERPERLAVIGGGVIGLELASYFCSAGTQVTVVEMLDHIAGDNDPDLVAVLKKNYEKKGVTFLLSAAVTEVTDTGLWLEQNGEKHFLPADRALLSIGRRASTAHIGLESIGLSTERGAVVTDTHMRTNQKGVYAAGDVNGRSMLAHTASREAEVAVNDLCGVADEMRYDAMPAVLYTNPELGAVGETEYTARQKGMDVTAVKLPMRFSGRYLAENEGGDGIMKLVINNATETVAGAQVLANYASEFIVSAGMCITLGLPLTELQKIVFPHPSVAEILREAAFQYRR